MKGKKLFKKFITSFNLHYFANGLACCYKYDEDFRRYACMLPEKFVFRMRMLADGDTLTISRNGDKLTAYSGKELTLSPDVDVCFKNIEFAFAFVTGRKSFATCLAQSAFVIKGDMSGMMTVSHMFDIVGSYILSKRLLRKYDRVLLPRTAGVHKIRFMTLFGRFGK